MCGRYTFGPGNLTLFADRFSVDAPPPASAAGYNVPPGRPVATVVHRAGSAPNCEMFHWGLIPAWAKSAERQYKMINARIETVTEKRAYSGLLAQHRCLIPADGFFEWQPVATDPSSRGGFIFRQPSYSRSPAYGLAGSRSPTSSRSTVARFSQPRQTNWLRRSTVECR